jgi:hypothetical protein
MADPIGSLISFSGLSFLGGLICATIAILWFAKKNNIKLLHLTDAALPGLMLAYGVGRMGCQIAGDGDWGIPNDAPKPEWLSFLPNWAWAYNYPNNVLGIDLKADFTQMGYVSLNRLRVANATLRNHHGADYFRFSCLHAQTLDNTWIGDVVVPHSWQESKEWPLNKFESITNIRFSEALHRPKSSHP